MDENTIKSISESIKEKHSSFLNLAGNIPYRLSANHALELSGVSSKVHLIFLILKNNDVISSYKKDSKDYYDLYELKKDGLDFGVTASVGTDCIVLSTLNRVVHEMDSIKDYIYKGEEWNWEKVSDQILNFIHTNMYKSQKVSDIYVESILCSEVSK
jgi:hypothetical protein